MVKKGTSSTTSKAVTVKKATSALNKGGNNKGTSAERILHAIASRAAFKEEKPCRKMIMGIACMTNVKSFATTILNMKNKGLVGYDRDTIWLTDKGKDQVGPEALEVPATNDGIQATLRDQVKGKVPREIFDLLLDGRAYHKSELAEMVGKKDDKSFGTYISSLSKVSERVKGKKIRLKDIAFPCGRP